METSLWRPGVSQEVLQARAVMLSAIRQFFAERAVLEVETPLLSRFAGTDPHLDPITADAAYPLNNAYLQTSPEFAMKRMLAAGSGPIYQVCKAFRQGEAGKRHNPEFTMLEWYRPGFSLEQLMQEVESLVSSIAPFRNFQRISYADLFESMLGIDPHNATARQLQDQQTELAGDGIDSDDRDVWLDYLFSHHIEPQLTEPTLIYDYPATQAALATIGEDDKGRLVARRFELVIGAMELANGYLELTDAKEQEQRFNRDLEHRQYLGKPAVTPDKHLLSALAHGLPQCSGVALGLDRLLMLILDRNNIDEVIAFSAERV